jgi:beta-carotene 3-hydroxylase
MNAIVLVLLAFVLMEPTAYLAHRLVMHGRLGGWHHGHHQVRMSTFERNDLYPLVAAAFTIVLIAAGTVVDSASSLVWIGAGITLYGAAYLFVHDLYIHRRIARFTWTCAPLERVREAHRIHHLWAGEPFGFLFPVVPRELRERARAVERDPLVVAR